MTNLRRPGAMSSQPFRQVCQFLRPATGANGRQRGRARADTAGDRNTLFCRVRPRVRLLLPRPRRPAERHDRIQSRRHSEALPSTSDGSPKFAPAPSPRPVSDISRRKPSHVRLDIRSDGLAPFRSKAASCCRRARFSRCNAARLRKASRTMARTIRMVVHMSETLSGTSREY